MKDETVIINDYTHFDCFETNKHATIYFFFAQHTGKILSRFILYFGSCQQLCLVFIPFHVNYWQQYILQLP